MIRRLTLVNWRAYDRLDLTLEPGATFVVAPNGVGKSSIVEGARYALFGAVPPVREGATRVSAGEGASAAVELQLPSGRILDVTRPYPPTGRKAAPTVTLEGESFDPAELDALLTAEYGADPAFLARLAMLHSSTVFTETKGLDLRQHLSRVFGVDGLAAALEQTKTLAQQAKKSVEAARKVATVSDEEVASLREIEARATDATEDAERERAEAEAALARVRETAEARRAYERWKEASDRYATLLAEVTTDATALLGRDVTADALESAEAEAVNALDNVRRRRSELEGRRSAITAGLTELEGAEGTCPVCRRPLDPDDVQTARETHETDLAALDAELTSLDDAEPQRLLDEVRRLRARLASEPAPGDAPPEPEDADPEDEAVARFDAAVATAAERRGILEEARRRIEAADAAQVELQGLTSAFARSAALEAATAALEAARQRVLDESIEPLEDLLAENWRKLFADRPGVGLQGDGTVSRRIGDADLAYEHFSDGEKMVAQLILRVLVLRATTRLGFFWVDEPLEHLDPDSRRALAVLLAQAPEDPSFPQVLVTTYEEPLVRRLRASVPGTHLVYVRPAAIQPAAV